MYLSDIELQSPAADSNASALEFQHERLQNLEAFLASGARLLLELNSNGQVLFKVRGGTEQSWPPRLPGLEDFNSLPTTASLELKYIAERLVKFSEARLELKKKTLENISELLKRTITDSETTNIKRGVDCVLGFYPNPLHAKLENSSQEPSTLRLVPTE